MGTSMGAIRRWRKWRQARKVRPSEEAVQVLYGSLMGDGALCKRRGMVSATFEENRNLKTKDYAEWKLSILSCFKPTLAVRYKYTYPYVHLSTKSFPYLTEIHSRWYTLKIWKDGKVREGRWRKVLPVYLLVKMNSLALAVWYMDDGSLHKSQDRITLATMSFTNKEVLTIKEWLREKWGIYCRIERVKDGKTGRNSRIVFTAHSTRKFIKIVKKYVNQIHSMSYKVR